ncbi:MAG: hypothetical protein FJ144_23050 [Deltaproteobacteria bacterium]|nr:hypothetical protein [Deltaproteobacteria bacterium]
MKPRRFDSSQIWSSLVGAGLFALGWACGGGASPVSAAATLFEFGGASLRELLGQAGPPPITTPVGIAEIVPEDGTRHFTLAVATENREARSDVAALYAEVDGYGEIGSIWGGNLLAFAHSDMRSGTVRGLEVDVGNLGTAEPVPVAGINVFAIGPQPSDVALGILNGTSAGPGGFREGIAFRSNPGGVAVHEALIRVQPGFGRVRSGIDLTEAEFDDAAIASPGFEVDADGGVRSDSLATGEAAYACVDGEGRLYASRSPCVARGAGTGAR